MRLFYGTKKIKQIVLDGFFSARAQKVPSLHARDPNCADHLAKTPLTYQAVQTIAVPYQE